MKLTNYIKKIGILLGAIVAISLACIPNLRAQQDTTGATGGAAGGATGGAAAGGNYLQQIAINTYGILKQVNNLPNYLNGLGQFIISWMTNDTSSSTTAMQGSFAALGNAIIQDLNSQNNKQLQIQMLADAVGVPTSDFAPQGAAQPTILKTLPNANDLAYSSLLGQPPIPKAPNVANAPYNYLKNAGALGLTHVMPGLAWQGDLQDQLKYSNYYNTLMSVESFTGYVLSSAYAEGQSGNQFNATQTTLITQASSSSWVAQIATEELGKVLRQILLFESQSYVLLSQLVQTQRQSLMAQTMTNSLIILTQQLTESQLVAKAQGVNPK